AQAGLRSGTLAALPLRRRRLHDAWYSRLALSAVAGLLRAFLTLAALVGSLPPSRRGLQQHALERSRHPRHELHARGKLPSGAFRNRSVHPLRAPGQSRREAGAVLAIDGTAYEPRRVAGREPGRRMA